MLTILYMVTLVTHHDTYTGFDINS